MIKQVEKETEVEDLIEVIGDLDDSNSKDGWLGWLGEYDKSGHYGRKPNMNYKARFMYNHNASPTGLLWLIEALGVNQELVKLAKTDYKRVKKVSENKHILSAVVRRRVPWKVVDRVLVERLIALNKAKLLLKKAALGL